MAAAHDRLGVAARVRARPKPDGEGMEWYALVHGTGGGPQGDCSADDLREAQECAVATARSCGWAVDLLASWRQLDDETYELTSLDDHDGQAGVVDPAS